MKTRINIALITMIFALLTISGCGKNGEKFGLPIDETEITSIKSIFENPQKYEGKTVKIKGKIVTECPTGCWFDIANNSAPIRVDINPSGFAIPQKIGSKALIQGKVILKNNNPTIIGTGVEIK